MTVAEAYELVKKFTLGRPCYKATEYKECFLFQQQKEKVLKPNICVDKSNGDVFMFLPPFRFDLSSQMGKETVLEID